MADLITQASAYNRTVLMTDATDHVSGKTGLTLTITLSKAGGAFSSITPTVTERGNGRYTIALTGSNTDTLGALDMHITASGADPTDTHDQIIGVNLADAVRAGLTSLPNVAAGGNGGLPTGDASGRVLLQPSQAGVTIPTVTALTNPVALSTNDEATLTSLHAMIAANAFTSGALVNSPTGSGGGLDASGIRAAVGLGAANLDTQLSGISTKTTNLPSDPADASDIAGAFTALNTSLSTLQTAVTLMSGLLGINAGCRNFVYSGSNLASYDLCIYDTANHAATNDGVTGLLHKLSVALTYTGSNQTGQVVTQVN